MKRFAVFTTVFAAVLGLLLPSVGSSGPERSASPSSPSSTATVFASAIVMPGSASVWAPTAVGMSTSGVATNDVTAANAAASPTASTAAAPATGAAAATVDSTVQAGNPVRNSVPAPAVAAQTVAVAKPVPAPAAPAAPAAPVCPSSTGGGGSAPGFSESGIGGTTSADIYSFSAALNAIRVANCLQPVPAANFRYDSCMEQRLFWMAEDPSTNPGNTWGHTGVKSLAPDANGVYYSDAVAAKGCDGNLAGGSGNTGATVAQKWWDSLPHRASLYRPTVTGSMAGVCIYFAMTHGGVPNESPGFTRAAARWGGC